MRCMHVTGQLFNVSFVCQLSSFLAYWSFLNFECTSKMMIVKFSDKLQYKLNVQAS